MDLSKLFDFARIGEGEYVEEKFMSAMKKDEYTILKYKKNALNAGSLDTLGMFRSVVIDNVAQQVVAFSPPKSYSFDGFKEKITEGEDDIVFEEYVEGTMINVFYHKDEWQLATRSLVGGRGVFFKDGKTFRQMFLECMNETGLEFDDLNKEYSYSFVIQHPSNRIVVRHRVPKLVLCAVYKCAGTIVSEINISDLNLSDKFRTPDVFKCETIQEAQDTYAGVDQTPYYIMGVVLKANGMRTKIRNPNYEYVRRLRGNQPKSQFQYLSLRKTGNVREFLKYYPEYTKPFHQYRKQVHDFTNTLHQSYVRCYIKKEKPLGQFPKEFRGHIYNLHQIYITKLMEEKKYVSLPVVIEYVNDMKSSHLMYAINYKYRTMKVHEAKEEKQEQLSVEEQAPPTAT